jgi:hypothetical protein
MIYLLAALATYRVTRFITADALFEPVREKIESVLEARSWHRGVYLINCDWCLSIWVAPLPAIAVMLWPENRGVLLALLILTFSAVTGLASTVEKHWET